VHVDDAIAVVAERGDRTERALAPVRAVPQPVAFGGAAGCPDRQLMADEDRLRAAGPVAGVGACGEYTGGELAVRFAQDGRKGLRSTHQLPG